LVAVNEEFGDDAGASGAVGVQPSSDNTYQVVSGLNKVLNP
jgi:hypothetical protein